MRRRPRRRATIAIKPGTKAAQPKGDERQEDHRGGGGNGDEPPLHPFIQGLLQTLPEPGSEWPLDEQATWLETAAHIFGLMYQRRGKIQIEPVQAAASQEESRQ